MPESSVTRIMSSITAPTVIAGFGPSEAQLPVDHSTIRIPTIIPTRTLAIGPRMTRSTMEMGRLPTVVASPASRPTSSTSLLRATKSNSRSTRSLLTELKQRLLARSSRNTSMSLMSSGVHRATISTSGSRQRSSSLLPRGR